MLSLDLGITGAKRQSYRSPSPRELLRTLLEAHPAASDSMLLRKFVEKLADDDDHLAVVIEYWFTNNLRSLRAKPKPIDSAATIAGFKAKLDGKIAQKAREILLDLIMPNGAPLRDCTGKDCSDFGGWFKKIADMVKPRQRVGSILSEDQVRALYGK